MYRDAKARTLLPAKTGLIVETIALYLVAGLIAGLVSGLFGMGGGLAVVPMLFIALQLSGISPDYLMHLSVGTSLAVVVLTSIYTTVLRGVGGDIDTDLLKFFVAPVAIGAVAGALVSDQLPGLALRVFFVCFVLYVMARLVLRALGRQRGGAVAGQAPLAMPERWGYGLIAGLCGAFLGIGVAAVLTPLLIRRGIRIQTASAMAAALAIVVGLSAGTGYVVGGLDEQGLPQASLGYVYLPALAGLAIGALAGSPLGIRLSRRLQEPVQVGLFLAYLAAVLVVMVTR